MMDLTDKGNTFCLFCNIKELSFHLPYFQKIVFLERMLLIFPKTGILLCKNFATLLF